MPEQNAFEQLMMLREVTRTTGVLHQAQVLQLRRYPLFLGAKASEFTYDLIAKKISYKILAQRRRVRRPIFSSVTRDEASALATWIKMLLGSEWTVQAEWRGRGWFGLFGGRVGLVFPPGEVSDGR